MGLRDDDIIEECEFDFRFQYALHTTSFEEQPLSDWTFSRFLERVSAYELVTGIDLVHACMAKLAENIREFMDISPDIKRVDSMMIESNIKKMGRLELLYTCLSNLAQAIRRNGDTELLRELAAEKNIRVLSTCLLGRKPKGILAEFVADDDGKKILGCPAGYRPKSCSYIRQTDSVRVSFLHSQCSGCPRQSECSQNIKKRTAVMIFSLKSRRNILERQSIMDAAARREVGRIRNGVETILSVLRNKYGVDKMPVRGKLKTKQFFGFKVVALNFTKLKRFLDGKAG